ncbi:MAG: DUF2971 domain-containing protein [Desulfobulbia bacterium]
MDEIEYERRISDLNGWAESVRAELASLITDRPASVIYHYTDIVGLMGIISSGRVWATHTDKLNDASENRHGYEFVADHVRVNLPRPSRPIFEKALSVLHSVDTYVTCYSTQSDLLSQWRNYAVGRVGYSLGFETTRMATGDGSMPLLEAVIYRDDVARSIIDQLLGRIDAYFGNQSFGEVEVGYVSGMVRAQLNIIACILKHPKFVEESEYRQIYQPSNSALVLNTEFRQGRFGLTPFVRIGFLEKDRLPLKTITIGPCQDPEIESNALKMFLSSNGYAHVEVLISEIPLRM